MTSIIDHQEQVRINISDMALDIRARNFLERNDLIYVDELEKITAAQLASFRGCGKLTLRNIRKAMAFYGKCLSGDYIATTEAEHRVIQNIPNLIQKIQWEVSRLRVQIDHLYDTLDQLHLNMVPRNDSKIL